MKLFVIHRTSSREAAEEYIRDVGSRLGAELEGVFLDSSEGNSWKHEAREEIYECAAVVVYDPKQCSGSENAAWEIEVAEQLEKKILEYSPNSTVESSLPQLKEVYEFECEFERYFVKARSDTGGALEIYKLIVHTSEELVRRRQITNGFFITVIGGLVAGSGFVLKEEIFLDNEILFLLLPVLVGFLLCRSWSNLIENYGKLNRAKFRVINRLERDLASQVFSVEWAALGKGLDRTKYRSFTATEQSVPSLFMVLLGLLIIPILWRVDWSVLTLSVADALTYLMSFLA